ncbi:hypothetical protein [Actinacidiphila glaucinigra]|uniref:hypothetical protein n=1 Tax=Actinacidiphila glaucinigra TaxID=235986 RepID=UPI003713ECA6
MTEETAGPQIDVALPDGQRVRAQLTEKTQARDGAWWFRLELSLCEQTELPTGKTTGDPWAVEFLAPADKVHPLQGVDYSHAPVTRHELHRCGSS